MIISAFFKTSLCYIIESQLICFTYLLITLCYVSFN